MIPLVKDVIVKQGGCVLNSCWKEYDNGEVAVLNFDSHTKYPKAEAYSGNSIYIHSDMVKTGEWTEVTIKTGRKRVNVYSDFNCRYGFTVVVSKTSRRRPKIFKDFREERP